MGKVCEYLRGGGLPVHPALGGDKVPQVREKLAMFALVDVLYGARAKLTGVGVSVS